jgi:outer membrane protein assembly factor BamD
MNRLVLALTAMVLITISCTNKLGKILKSKDNEYKYKMAERYFVQKKYHSAQQLFEDVYPYYRGTAQFEDLNYKLAYCYFNMKDFANAEQLFKTFAEIFPSSKKAEEAEYMRAYSYFKQIPKVELDQTPTTKTMGLMQAFINNHPNSPRNKDAADIIDQCRAKLEEKEYKSALLYYQLGFYRAAAIAFTTLIENFPDSDESETYKLQVVKAYFKFAEQSVEEKQLERFEKVISECVDFEERFSDSKLKEEILDYKNNAKQKIKNIQNNEQIKKAA